MGHPEKLVRFEVGSWSYGKRFVADEHNLERYERRFVAYDTSVEAYEENVRGDE